MTEIANALSHLAPQDILVQKQAEQKQRQVEELAEFRKTMEDESQERIERIKREKNEFEDKLRKQNEEELRNLEKQRKYSKRRRSNVAVIIVRNFFLSLFLFYCLLLNHSFQTKPNRITNCFKLFSLLQLTTTLLLHRFFDFWTDQEQLEKEREEGDRKLQERKRAYAAKSKKNHENQLEQMGAIDDTQRMEILRQFEEENRRVSKSK